MASSAAPRLPIGLSDFLEIRRRRAYYVDKSLFVRDVLQASADVLLFTRPRRFGKTLNLMTLRAFLEPSTSAEARSAFEGLAIAGAPQEVWDRFGAHPVIALSLKDVKQETFEAAMGKVRDRISDAYETHWAVIEPAFRSPADRERAESIRRGDASQGAYEDALMRLSRLLHAATGQRVAILIDEYDTPLHAGFSHGYLDRISLFLRNLFSAALKDNTDLHRGVLTGVLRVAKEGLFSGLNNLQVDSILDADFSHAFGFEEHEVDALLTARGCAGSMDDVRRWYDGYSFGSSRIYNPWSVVSFADRPAAGPRPYWVFTGSDDAIRTTVLERGEPVANEVSALLGGGTVEKVIREHVTLGDMLQQPGSAWALLLHAGYLTARSVSAEGGGWRVALALPNLEAHYVLETSIRSWLEGGTASGSRLERMTEALLRGDAETVEAQLGEILVQVLSHHDLPWKDAERGYHAFLLGLLVQLRGRYHVRSNIEAGHGRFDVMLSPSSPDQPGVILELKRVDREDAAGAALAAGLAQVAAQDYAAPLREQGVRHVLAYALVFHGKRVWVRLAPE